MEKKQIHEIFMGQLPKSNANCDLVYVSWERTQTGRHEAI